VGLAPGDAERDEPRPGCGAAGVRLYYDDCYLREFSANVIETREADGAVWVYLDQTAFYPASGGQPHDLGTLGGALIKEVLEDGERIAHITESALPVGPVQGRIDWERRFDFMQQHTGQHMLSAVILKRLGIPTLSVHFGPEISTVDLEISSLETARIEEVERYANDAVFENRPVRIEYRDNAEDLALRKASGREGKLRIVSIEGLDRSACGGTHVRTTGEIGPIMIRKTGKIRDSVRLEFLCGRRAVRRARADFNALSTIARAFSAPLEETPGLVASRIEAAAGQERILRKLSAQVAEYQGQELYRCAQPDANGRRVFVERNAAGSLDEATRALAQSFAAQPGAVFLALAGDPASVLLAASADSGFHAGNSLKAAATKVGGRGGGSPTMAQGSVPIGQAEALMDELRAAGLPI
jgi:alanyl-tRNA synthetase